MAVENFPPETGALKKSLLSSPKFSLFFRSLIAENKKSNT
jgi:hypothetical protein